MGTSLASDSSNQVTSMVAPAAPVAPSVTAQPASLSAAWSAPAGSCGIDEYELDAYDTATNTLRGSLTTSATSGQLSSLPACAYPGHSCSSPTTYYLTLRAHNSAGWGATVSSSSVRPLVSFTGDSIPTLFSANGCNACHTAATGNRLVLDTSQAYQNILSVLAGKLSQIYICPSGSAGCEPPLGHPGGTQFTTTSKEYALLVQWVTDGARQ
jgi:hypothetical protein